MPLSAEHLAIIKATAPVVAAHAEQITSTFYGLMFKNDPVVRNFFNPSHQASRAQPQALANAVVAYALNIDQLQNLGEAVELMAAKHCSLMVQPEHYDIVARNLMAAIHEVLGAAVTQPVHDAWVAAYMQLAGILIGRERAIYAEQLSRPGGWNGYRPFLVSKIVEESGDIRSFYLRPQDKGALPAYKAGQYLTLHFDAVPGATTPIAPRNYSLSGCCTTAEHFRISVKRVPGGVVSCHLHDRVRVGDVLQVGPPCGEFHFSSGTGRPVIFIAGGIGVTPLLPMLAEARQEGRQVTWVESHRGRQPHMVRDLLHGQPADILHLVDTGRAPRLSAKAIAALCPDLLASDVYVCGPRAFLQHMLADLAALGVPAAQLRFEYFGPLAKPVRSPAPSAVAPAAAAASCAVDAAAPSLELPAGHPPAAAGAKCPFAH